MLDAVTEYYEVFFILVGVIGFYLGFDRITKDDEEESDKLEFLGFIGGVALFIIIILSIFNDEPISKYTIVFGSLYSLSLIAKTFKKLPIAFALSALVGLGLTYYALNERSQNDEFFGGLSIQLVFIIIILIVAVVFILSFIQEATMDIMLWLLSWGIVILVLSAIIFLQGITLLLELPDKDGLLGLLPG